MNCLSNFSVVLCKPHVFYILHNIELILRGKMKLQCGLSSLGYTFSQINYIRQTIRECLFTF